MSKIENYNMNEEYAMYHLKDMRNWSISNPVLLSKPMYDLLPENIKVLYTKRISGEDKCSTTPTY